MKLITWNIQWGRGVDGRVDLDRIVRTARAMADFDVLCVQEERVVGNDNTVVFQGLRLQIPQSRLRAHFVKAKVRVHQYADGTHAIFHGPQCLARYLASGNLIEKTVKWAA